MAASKQKRLWMMCGIPGSGKSTWAIKYMSKIPGSTEYVSRDAVRFSIVNENEEYFSKEKEVFNIFIKRIKQYLETKEVVNVIADATHISPSSRAKLLNNLGDSLKDVEIIAIVMDTPLEIALERNAKREGRSQVPESALRNMANSFKIPKLEEGFDRIYIYKDGEKVREIVKEVETMGSVWFTSDWHFGHDREFIYKPRGFNSVWEMNEAIISRHNEVVAPDDDVYVLGDLLLGDNEAGMRRIKQLKGQLHIVRGNHDSQARIELYNQCYNIVEITEGQFFKWNNYHFYLSHYPCLTANNDSDKPLKAKVINICGHSHTQDSFADWNKGTIFHCEVDTRQDCSPWNIEEIIKLIKEK